MLGAALQREEEIRNNFSRVTKDNNSIRQEMELLLIKARNEVKSEEKELSTFMISN
jgi:hypothetical protein